MNLEQLLSLIESNGTKVEFDDSIVDGFERYKASMVSKEGFVLYTVSMSANVNGIYGRNINAITRDIKSRLVNMLIQKTLYDSALIMKMFLYGVEGGGDMLRQIISDDIRSQKW